MGHFNILRNQFLEHFNPPPPPPSVISFTHDDDDDENLIIIGYNEHFSNK